MMNPPVLNVLMCSYSYHSQRFHIKQENEGLKNYLFRLQTEGHAKALVNGVMTPLQAGDLLLYRPGMPYSLLVDEHEHDRRGPSASSGDYYLYCQGTWVDDWWNRSPKQVKTRIDLDDKLLSVWRMILTEKLKFEESNEELVGYLFRSLCLMLDKAIVPAPALKGTLFTAARMKSYIEEHATTPLKIEDIARHVSLSVSRAVHLFKECYGKSMIQYTLEIRLSIARERMAYSMMTLEQIAESCGFGSYSYFHRIFRDKHGVTPTEYRNTLRGG
ncbi:helix-turn-helix domain-containing protein [Paenibacillus sp. MBLB4367]|uniref:helix-turn-helix domain-containing protein n=1 Tax=Paenibacillus sp. MBLB4367 TaxID=3384767 RepID=UPI0039081F36